MNLTLRKLIETNIKKKCIRADWGRGDTLLVTGRTKNEQRKAVGGSRKKVGAIRGRIRSNNIKVSLTKTKS